MISLPVYKLLHIIGLVLAVVSLGCAIGFSANGGTKAENRWRKLIGALHGTGLLLLLVGGFGMLAKLDTHWPWPGWVSFKLVLWLILGGAIALGYKKPAPALILVVAVTSLAAFAALLKPF